MLRRGAAEQLLFEEPCVDLAPAISAWSLAAIGALNARKGAKLKLARSEEIHEVSRGFTFWFTLERDIQIRRRSERVQQCPKREALTQVRCQTEIDLHVLDAGIERFLRD